MAISKLRITAAQLLPRVRSAARSSHVLQFVPPLEMRSMAGVMNFRQVQKCLHEGQMVGKPKLNEHGHWEFRMERFAANQWTEVRGIAIVEGARVTKIYVLREE